MGLSPDSAQLCSQGKKSTSYPSWGTFFSAGIEDRVWISPRKVTADHAFCRRKDCARQVPLRNHDSHCWWRPQKQDFWEKGASFQPNRKPWIGNKLSSKPEKVKISSKRAARYCSCALHSVNILWSKSSVQAMFWILWTSRKKKKNPIYETCNLLQWVKEIEWQSINIIKW